jgi:hypothetical protein
MWWLFGRGSKSIESFKYQYSSRGSALHSLLLALLNQFSFRPLGHPLLDESGEHLTENKIESRGMSPLADRLPDREAWYFSEWFYFNASTGICTTQEG